MSAGRDCCSSTDAVPPSVRDSVPEWHLVWTVLDAVGELDLSAFYAAYRAGGHGPAGV